MDLVVPVPEAALCWAWTCAHVNKFGRSFGCLNLGKNWRVAFIGRPYKSQYKQQAGSNNKPEPRTIVYITMRSYHHLLTKKWYLLLLLLYRKRWGWCAAVACRMYNLFMCGIPPGPWGSVVVRRCNERSLFFRRPHFSHHIISLLIHSRGINNIR